MNRRTFKNRYSYLTVFIVYLVGGTMCVAQDHVWLQWRGPMGTGVAPDSSPPTEWSESQNIRWKSSIPGKGHSTPIVTAKYVFLTTAIPIGPKLPPKMSGRPGEHDNLPVDSRYQFAVVCLDRQSGEIRWQTPVHEAIPLEAGHNTGSLASASPVSDGKFIYAHFGSYGLFCLNFDGQVVWQKDFGQMHSKHGHGEGASPALHDNLLVINWDDEEHSFVVAIDTTNGQEVWRRDRKEDTSWSSPIIIELNGRQQVVVCGTNRLRGYDLMSGDVLWECGGMSSNIVATPVFRNGILYVGSSYEKRVLMAIDLNGAKGDITESKRILWSRSRGTPYVPSMLLYGDSLYFLTHYQNVLTRVDGPSGRDNPGTTRLGSLGNIYASPVGASGHVYITDLAGTTEVIEHGPIPRTISVNRLDEGFAASLAIAGNEIFARSEHHLYCIAE
jgi:outer membrane protein assembly factor BamB